MASSLSSTRGCSDLYSINHDIKKLKNAVQTHQLTLSMIEDDVPRRDLLQTIVADVATFSLSLSQLGKKLASVENQTLKRQFQIVHRDVDFLRSIVELRISQVQQVEKKGRVAEEVQALRRRTLVLRESSRVSVSSSAASSSSSSAMVAESPKDSLVDPAFSEQVKIPDYFGKRQEEASFKESFRSCFPKLDPLQIPHTDFQRFTIAREAVFEQAWQDYLTTCHALENSGGVIFAERGQPPSWIHDSLAKNSTAHFSFIGSKDRVSIEPVSAGLLNNILYDLSQHKHWRDHEKAAFKRSMNHPYWQFGAYKNFDYYGTSLTIQVANTNMSLGLLYIEWGADVNKYAPRYGNNPLTIAAMKGWNHKDSETSWGESQKPILDALLSKRELDINAIDLRTGMSALQYASMRGDDPVFIEKLLERGADPTHRDYSGKTALDLLDMPYTAVKKLLLELGGADFDNGRFGERGRPENAAITVTVPLERERVVNIATIRRLLAPST